MGSATALEEAPLTAEDTVTTSFRQIPREPVPEPPAAAQDDWAALLKPVTQIEPVHEPPVAGWNDWAALPGPVTQTSLHKEPTISWPNEETQFSGDATISLGIVQETGPRVRRSQKLLRPDISREAKQWLTGDLNLVHDQAVLFCVQESNRMHLRLKNICLTVKRSWEGEFSELVLQVFAEANLPQSLALWDAIGDAIQDWGKKQSVRLRRILDEKYAVFIEPLLQV